MSKHSSTTKAWQRLLALLFIIVLFWISYIATRKPNTFAFIYYFSWGDKLAHFLLFGFAASAMVFSLPWKASPVISFLVMSCLVLIEELLQLLSATRNFSFPDLIASLSGVAVFCFLSGLYQRTRKQSLSPE